MKKTCLTVLYILLHHFIIAQPFDPIVATIHYNYKHASDTSDRKNYKEEEILAHLGKHSVYTESYDFYKLSDELERQSKDPANGGHLTLRITGNSSTINEYYYINTNQKYIVRQYQFQGGHFLIKDDYPIQNWKVEPTIKEIGGYSCQKATAIFKGRNYTAWFTEEIPIPFGPWKLHGLPGLILEAYDDKKEVVFEYNGFTTNTDTKWEIGVNKSLPINTIGEIEKLEKALEENPQAFYQTFQGVQRIDLVKGRKKSAYERNIKGKYSIDIISDESHNPPKKDNNPIELKN